MYIFHFSLERSIFRQSLRWRSLMKPFVVWQGHSEDFSQACLPGQYQVIFDHEIACSFRIHIVRPLVHICGKRTAYRDRPISKSQFFRLSKGKAHSLALVLKNACQQLSMSSATLYPWPKPGLQDLLCFCVRTSLSRNSPSSVLVKQVYFKCNDLLVGNGNLKLFIFVTWVIMVSIPAPFSDRRSILRWWKWASNLHNWDTIRRTLQCAISGKLSSTWNHL